MNSSNTHFNVIYASETGNAESIAQEIVATASTYNLRAQLYCADKVGQEVILQTSEPIIFVISTTGDGDPPQHARKLFRDLRKMPGTCLGNLFYTILGLGDTNYNSFCNAGKTLNERLQKLGAQLFYAPAWADDSQGLETVVPDWIDRLWDTMVTKLKLSVGLCRLSSSTSFLKKLDLRVPKLPASYLAISYSNEDIDLTQIPYQNGAYLPSSCSGIVTSYLSECITLTSDDALKCTKMLDLTIEPGLWSFEPGDSIGICCENNAVEVQNFIERLNAQDVADLTYKLSLLGNTSKPGAAIPAHIPTSATLRHIFTTCCDIRAVPKKALLRALAEVTSSESEQRRLLELSSADLSADYSTYVREPNVGFFDILLTFPSCAPTVSLVLEHLPRLQPRPYSICSSSYTDASRLCVLFNVQEIPEGEPEVRIYLRHPTKFRHPDNLNVPIIMVGPGTGVAPFVGFLAKRQWMIELDKTVDLAESWLFYGCRHPDKDYLLRDKLDEFVTNGTLSKLCTSFSRHRENEKLRYVQDSLRLHGAAIAKLLMNDEIRIYVCGDARKMAPDVFACFKDILIKNEGMSEENAAARLAVLRDKELYVTDVWT